jgi:hypothetical protein
MTTTRIKAKTPTPAKRAPRRRADAVCIERTVAAELAALHLLDVRMYLMSSRVELLAQKICGGSGVTPPPRPDAERPSDLIAALSATRARFRDALDRCAVAVDKALDGLR